MESEKALYYPKDKKQRIFRILTKHVDIVFYKAVMVNRKYLKAKNKNQKIKMLYYGRLANKYARNYNLELYGEFGNNFRIWHSNIIINGNAKLGNNINMHGNNCIGNNGKNDRAPIIGDNVDIGFGATIIGDIKIASNIKIGAYSLVNKSFEEEGITIAGVPAKVIAKK